MIGSSSPFPTSGIRPGKRVLRSWYYYVCPVTEKLTKPVFILGCGRSGTTILGTLIGYHPAILYCNEPRHIWALDPQTDIWTEYAHRRQGKIRLIEDDVKPPVARRIRRAFWLHLRWRRRPQLVEKSPINSFRIPYLTTIFPDARFILALRNGAEVARSIDRVILQNGWFGTGDYKWHQLVALAHSRGEAELVDMCKDGFTKGLLEWRLSVSTALADLKTLPAERRLDIRYEDLFEDQKRVVRTIEAFIGLDHSSEMENFSLQQIKRKTRPFDMEKLSENHMAIAGQLLERLGFL